MISVFDSQRRKPRHTFWQIVWRIGAGLIGLVVFLAIGGATWNAVATCYYRDHYPAPGQIYTVNGFPMHMYCTGSGSPTLILDAGLGDDWTVWAKVQPMLSKTTQVCSFDRAGLGWSDEQSTGHDANTLADQLHALLLAAGIHKPVVLMGHSVAALYDRAYTARYPDDVAGLILVDGSSPDQRKRYPVEYAANNSGFTWQKWETAFGVARLMGLCSQVMPGFESERGWIYANNCRISAIDTQTAEYDAFDRSSDETLHTGPFGDLPMLIFSEDPAKRALANPGGFSKEVMKKVAQAWEDMQEDFKRLSTNSRRIVAHGSSHYIAVDRADLLNREVPVFIQQLRNRTIAPDNGTTKVE
jgi:pimeloyl-ACP methyl ester carboxylesterase